MRCRTPATIERRPLVSAAIGEFDGTLTTLKPYEDGAGRHAQPDLSLPFPGAAAAGNVPACAEAGLAGALAGVLGR